TLACLRQTILDVLPEAEQGISYGAPAFKIRGKTVAGFAAFKNHLSYLPHSGSVFPELPDELAAFSTSSGALRFEIDKPLPRSLLSKGVERRDGCSPGAGHIQVRHEGEGSHCGSLRSQADVLPHRPQKPLPEGLCRLDNAASHKVGVRVEHVGDDGEQPSDRL